MTIMQFAEQHPQLAAHIEQILVVAFVSLVFAKFPATSPVGQFVRRWLPDVLNKNLNTMPPTVLDASKGDTKS